MALLVGELCKCDWNEVGESHLSKANVKMKTVARLADRLYCNQVLSCCRDAASMTCHHVCLTGKGVAVPGPYLASGCYWLWRRW